MKKFTILTALFLSLCAVSCKNFSGQNDASASAYEVTSLREQIQSSQNNMNSVVQAVKSLQEQNQQLAFRIQELQTRLDGITQQPNITPQLAADIQTLRAAIQAVDENRIRDAKALADATTKQLNQTNAAVQQLATSPRAAASSQSSDVAAGEYYKHTVKAGQTLGAIAQAYKVSVGDIQTANKFKGTNIFVGQVLLVPKKN